MAIIYQGTGSLSAYAGSDVTVNLTVANPTGSAITFTATLGSTQIESNTVVPGFGVCERTAIVLPAGATLSCTTPAANTQFTAYGY